MVFACILPSYVSPRFYCIAMKAGVSALQYAALNGHVHVVKLLAEYDAEVEVRNRVIHLLAC